MAQLCPSQPHDHVQLRDLEEHAAVVHVDGLAGHLVITPDVPAAGQGRGTALVSGSVRAPGLHA